MYFARSNSGLANSDDPILLCTFDLQGMPKFLAEMKEAKEAKDRNALLDSRETCHEQKVTLFSI